ncbi:MAG: DUF4450 domain-containing protein [Opitutaceae bacterium]
MFRLFACLLCLGTCACASAADAPSAARVTPNLTGNLERPLRYRPDGVDFVIENGAEFFNRPLYGGNTAFRVDGGDRPEFVLYLPGRGGNLRFGVRNAAGTRWLHEAAQIETRYRPGELLYEIRDPLLGDGRAIQLAAVAPASEEGLILRVELSIDRPNTPEPALELIWAFGGVNGQRGKRDGDIGTEKVPIGAWFQLRPEFCRGNRIALTEAGFRLRAAKATIAGTMPVGAQLAVGDAAHWDDPVALLASVNRTPECPVAVGHMALAPQRPLLLALQRLPAEAAPSGNNTGDAPVAEPNEAIADAAPVAAMPELAAADLPRRFAQAQRHFRQLRQRVSVETPDPFLDAAVGALNVAADAVWDAPQQAIMHGAIAWRVRLLGWRGPYALDALGWHDRARAHFDYWAGRQNSAPIPATLPPADEAANLARNETGLHSNGDLSQSHYDMNLVAIDALFRHLRWTGDRAFAERMWPAIERHLAWERRLFRREFGPEKLPLYEAYAAIWASDDLQYHGGGTAHASAYNFFHNSEAARLARWLGHDPASYETEAALIARAMRELLWLPGRGGFAEHKDWLGLQRVHPSAALWTFYHTLDSAVPTPQEAWAMTRKVDAEIPHLPVRGPGVPEGLEVLSTTDWMPYTWSINNVVMAENVHTALGYWQAGRPEEAWRLAKSALTAAMYLGISPGNVGSMSYLDVYRRESQRDFADGSGVLSRALVEGLFGVRPDMIAGELVVSPGFPAEWEHASLRHPDFSVRFERTGNTDHYIITQRFAEPLALRFGVAARGDRVGSLAVNGDNATWSPVEGAIGTPRIEINCPPGYRHEVLVSWAGAPIAAPVIEANRSPSAQFVPVTQGAMRWLAPSDDDARWPQSAPAAPPVDGCAWPELPAKAQFDCVELSGHFNDRVTQIFRNEYRSPRSPFVSLALPKQGIGGWAGGVNATAEIDDSGLRATAARRGGRIELGNGVPLATPANADSANVAFVSQWDNYPREVTVPLIGRAHSVFLLLAGSTNHMQSRFANGEVVVTYADGTSERLALENPTNWWPIEQDYFLDDHQFRRPGPLPARVDLRTGEVRRLTFPEFKGRGGRIPGGAAIVLALPLHHDRELRSLTVRTLANEVVVGLMAATLVR